MDTTTTTEHQPQEDERFAGDLLVGADAIRAFLITLGMPESVDPYYLKRAHWPIGNTGRGGGKLIASKRRLARHTQKIAAGTSERVTA
jgi:hypothetical protein